MPIDPVAFKAARNAKGWTQDQLADAAAVSQTTIDKIERGETQNSRYLPQLAAALEASVAQLSTGLPPAAVNNKVPLAGYVGACGEAPLLVQTKIFSARSDNLPHRGLTVTT